jgi:hypothetical protein
LIVSRRVFLLRSEDPSFFENEKAFVPTSKHDPTWLAIAFEVTPQRGYREQCCAYGQLSGKRDLAASA